jgi:hypothetical protein
VPIDIDVAFGLWNAERNIHPHETRSHFLPGREMVYADVHLDFVALSLFWESISLDKKYTQICSLRSLGKIMFRMFA